MKPVKFYLCFSQGLAWDFHLHVSPPSANQALTVDKTDPITYSGANKISAFGTLLTDGSQQAFSSTTCRRIFYCLPARRLDKNCWRGIRKQIRTTCCYLIPRYSHVLDFPLWNSPGSHCFPPQMRVERSSSHGTDGGGHY